VDAEVVTSVIDKLSEVFGTEAALTVHRGKVHDYLGMIFDFTIQGKVVITMEEYIQTILSDVPEDMSGTARTPASAFLFEINNKNPEYLTIHKANEFHTLVAKLLFLCKRARRDIQTAVSFLYTRVKKPDVDDYKKLGRVIKYLRGTDNIKLTLESKNKYYGPEISCHTKAYM